jgi:hypothetical protein
MYGEIVKLDRREENSRNIREHGENVNQDRREHVSRII